MSTPNFPARQAGSAELVAQGFDAAMMTPPWFQADITQSNPAALMDNLAGTHPLSPAPFHDLYAPGSRTQRDSRRYGSADANQTTAGVSDTITHTGKRGLYLQASVTREQTQYYDGSYTYDHSVSVVSQQPRGFRRGR